MRRKIYNMQLLILRISSSRLMPPRRTYPGPRVGLSYRPSIRYRWASSQPYLYWPWIRSRELSCQHYLFLGSLLQHQGQLFSTWTNLFKSKILMKRQLTYAIWVYIWPERSFLKAATAISASLWIVASFFLFCSSACCTCLFTSFSDASNLWT